MNKYEHSKIYKIVNDVDDMVYVGSTTHELYERWVDSYVILTKNENRTTYSKHRI